MNIVPECIFSTECIAENPLNYHFLQNARYLVLMVSSTWNFSSTTFMAACIIMARPIKKAPNALLRVGVS